MLALLLAAAAWSGDAPPPTPVGVDVSWRARTARLGFDVPEGFHVAPDAPLEAALSVSGVPYAVQTEGLSARAGLAVPIPITRPVLIEGSVVVSVCDDAGSSCRVVQRTVQGVLDTPKGAGLVLDEAEASSPEAHHGVDFSTALAGAGDGLVLIDFGAVWCPPCNLLAAEVLHDPADAALLDGIQLVEVDVDDHASWSLKSRYVVGGYPTLVAVDSSGAEVARLVGYPGEEAVHTWLADLPTVTPLSTPPDPSTLTPEEAGDWALRFVEGQRGELAGPYFSRASQAPEHVLSARLATYLLRPSPKLALELADGGVPLTTWGWAALSYVEKHPDLAERIRIDARAALADASSVEAADLFYMLAKVAPPDDAPDLFRASAVALSAGLSGDLALDRGHLGMLSRMWEYAGDIDQAAAVLAPALERWPTDMTFHEDRAALALRTGDVDTAITHGALAVEHGLGDNRLRALELYARALHEGGRTDEAVTLVRQTLDQTPVPEDGIQVRTPRYLKALRELPFLSEAR